MNLWHDVSRGDNIPEEVNCIIETPKGSVNKYEIDKDSGLIALDRANYNGSSFPFDYGFIPQTLWEDNDAIDVVLLSNHPVPPGIMVRIRPVGVLEMIDTGESDWKIIGVPVDDKKWDDIQNISDLSKHALKQYAHFFENYKELKKENETGFVKVPGFKDKNAAFEAINKSVQMYEEKFGKNA
ncbi:inorganic diphosphatase [Patescibacteria group bacterium]|nr:inorganic diphosphatase [Patescibacteria group bacterium]